MLEHRAPTFDLLKGVDCIFEMPDGLSLNRHHPGLSHTGEIGHGDGLDIHTIQRQG